MAVNQGSVVRVTPNHHPTHYEDVMTYEEYTELREKVGITEYKVAKECTTGNAFFYKWRKGMIKPKKSTLERITNYLKGKE